MKTQNEVASAFAPTARLSSLSGMAVLKVEVAFRELATEILELVPDSPGRITALYKLLDAKTACVQAITGEMTKSTETTKPVTETTQKKVKHGKKKKEN